MHTLVINCGSSSLKYALFDMPAERVPARGHVDRIGPAAHHRHDAGDATVEYTGSMETTEAAMARVAEVLADSPVDAVGHRVVHGSDQFHHPALIDAEVIDAIAACSKLAPLHNPANLAGIHASRHAFKNVPQVAVFDTAFFQSIEKAAFRYAVPQSWTTQYGVRRYGFHGTSHRYATLRAGELLGSPTPDVITIHLGNGCSMACVRDGKPIDTTMGMTPLEGLVMGTRSGDVDPGMIFHLLEAGLSIDEIHDGLQHVGGLLAVSGVSSDMRDVLAAEQDGNADASLAVEIFVRRVRKYLGSYLLQLPRCDAVIFTGGIAQHAPLIRRRILADLNHLGIRLNSAANDAAIGAEAHFHQKDSPIQLWTIPANEELLIARETVSALHADE